MNSIIGKNLLQFRPARLCLDITPARQKMSEIDIKSSAFDPEQLDGVLCEVELHFVSACFWLHPLA